MKILIVSHTYIAPINRDKWKILSQKFPNTKMLIVFPKRWTTCIFAHKASITENENTQQCSFVALETYKEGNELLYTYKHIQFLSLIRSFKPDLIHVEQGAGALSYMQANMCAKLLRLNIPTIFFTWVNWEPALSLKHKIFLSPIEKMNLNCAGGAIVGNYDARKILEKNGFKKPILVLPQLGVNSSIFAPKKIEKKTSHTICFIGRIIEEKGVFLLAKAFSKLAPLFPSWKLLFVGQGPCNDKLNTLIGHLGLIGRIIIQMPVAHHEVARILQHTDIFVLPSQDTPTWREQFGHVLIEAMACKVPVIASNAGQIPYVVGKAGRIFQQGDEHSLIEHLRALMQDEILRKKLGESGYQRVHQHYTHEVIAEKTHAFWQSMMK